MKLGVKYKNKCENSVVVIEDFVKGDGTIKAPKSQFSRLQNDKKSLLDNLV